MRPQETINASPNCSTQNRPRTLGHHVVHKACRSEWSSQQLPHLQVCQLLVQVQSQRWVCSACRHLCKTISFRIRTTVFEPPALGSMRMTGCPMHLHPDPSEAHQDCCSCDLTPSCASSRSRPLRRDKISRRVCACRLARSPMGARSCGAACLLLRLTFLQPFFRAVRHSQWSRAALMAPLGQSIGLQAGLTALGIAA